MSLYAEWLDTQVGPVVVDHDGLVAIGEFGDRMTPDDAELVVATLQYAISKARQLQKMEQ